MTQAVVIVPGLRLGLKAAFKELSLEPKLLTRGLCINENFLTDRARGFKGEVAMGLHNILKFF